MKSIAAVILFALGGSVIAQEQCAKYTKGFGDCIFKCITESAEKQGCKGPGDYACACEHFDAIQAAALPCASKCNPSAIPGALQAGKDLCACVGSARSAMPTTTVSKPSSSAAFSKAVSTHAELGPATAFPVANATAAAASGSAMATGKKPPGGGAPFIAGAATAGVSVLAGAVGTLWVAIGFL